MTLANILAVKTRYTKKNHYTNVVPLSCGGGGPKKSSKNLSKLKKKVINSIPSGGPQSD